MTIGLKMKKRWKPEVGTEYYYYDSKFNDIDRYVWDNSSIDIYIFNSLGVYKTRSDAEAMAEKIRKFITKEIGSI